MRVPSTFSQVQIHQDLTLTRELSAYNAPHPDKDPASIPERAQVFSLEELKDRTRWIRDILEPQIARQGQRFLEADTTLDLQQFLSRLRSGYVSLERIRESRIHKAVLSINGKATRWPSKLVDLADAIVEKWTLWFGPLEQIRTALYEPGGRLHGICEVHELHRTDIVERWQADPSTRVSCLNAWIHGSLGFKPGHWWLHPLFAFHDGVIDSPSPWGGISADEESAYAIVLTHYAEIEKVPDPDESSESDSSYDHFWYRSKSNDPGRFRLKNAILPPKQPIRVLRSHTLHSEHRPHVGLRYEGLYFVTGFRVKDIGGVTNIDLKLKRQSEQVSMKKLMKRPTAEEVDDYLEFQRLRESQMGEIQAFETLATNTARMMHMNDSLDDEPFVELSKMRHRQAELSSDEKQTVKSILKLAEVAGTTPSEEASPGEQVLTPTSEVSMELPRVSAAHYGLVPSRRLKHPVLDERPKSMNYYEEHKIDKNRLDESASWHEAQAYDRMTKGVADLRELDKCWC